MKETLFGRLGGKSAIDALVDRVMDLHLQNEVVGTRYRNLGSDRLERSRQKAKEFFAAGAGGPVEYTGMSMVEAHRGMNVSPAEFLAVVDDIMQAMQEQGHDPAVRDEVLGVLYSLKPEIVHH